MSGNCDDGSRNGLYYLHCHTAPPRSALFHSFFLWCRPSFRWIAEYICCMGFPFARDIFFFAPVKRIINNRRLSSRIAARFLSDHVCTKRNGEMLYFRRWLWCDVICAHSTDGWAGEKKKKTRINNIVPLCVRGVHHTTMRPHQASIWPLSLLPLSARHQHRS